MDTVPRAKCSSCGATLDPYSTAPCPKCGALGSKKVEKIIEGRVAATGTVDRARIRERFTFNRRAIALLVLVTLIQPFGSLALRGVAAIVTSGVLSVAGLVVGSFAMVKTREIERHI